VCLHIGAIIGSEGAADGVRFVEGAGPEPFHPLPQCLHFLFIVAVVPGRGQEFLPAGSQRVVLCAVEDGAHEGKRPKRRVIPHQSGNHHQLFLVENQAVSLGKELVNRPDPAFPDPVLLLCLAVLGKEFHVAGAQHGFQGRQLKDVGRFDEGQVLPGDRAPQPVTSLGITGLYHLPGLYIRGLRCDTVQVIDQSPMRDTRQGAAFTQFDGTVLFLAHISNKPGYGFYVVIFNIQDYLQRLPGVGSKKRSNSKLYLRRSTWVMARQ